MGKGKRERWKFIGSVTVDGHRYYKWKRRGIKHHIHHWLVSDYINHTTGTRT